MKVLGKQMALKGRFTRKSLLLIVPFTKNNLTVKCGTSVEL